MEQIISSPFKVITYDEAIRLLTSAPKKFSFPLEWGKNLQAEHERYLTEEIIKAPVFIINYPKEIKAFYMKSNPDGKTVKAMDMLVPRVGEIIGGSEREDDIDILTANMKSRRMNLKNYWWYLDLRRFGSTPHAGFGLGFERFLQFITGISNIRDVIPFPRTPGRLEF